MNELLNLLEQCFYEIINEDNGAAFASDVDRILKIVKDPKKQGIELSNIKRTRLNAAKKRADYIDEGTPEAFAVNFLNKLKALNKNLSKEDEAELKQFAISYYNLATKFALTQNADTIRRAKSMAAGNGAGSQNKHIPSSEGNLERARKPQLGNKISASVETIFNY